MFVDFLNAVGVGETDVEFLSRTSGAAVSHTLTVPQEYVGNPMIMIAYGKQGSNFDPTRYDDVTLTNTLELTKLCNVATVSCNVPTTVYRIKPISTTMQEGTSTGNKGHDVILIGVKTEANTSGGGAGSLEVGEVTLTVTGSWDLVATLPRPPKIVCAGLMYTSGNGMEYIYEVDSNTRYRTYGQVHEVITDTNNVNFKVEGNSLYVYAGTSAYQKSTKFRIYY